MLADAKEPPVSFIAVNCDLSRTPAKQHNFRCALISEMIRVLYEDMHLTKSWGTGRVLLLGSFKSPPDSPPYDYLTRLYEANETKFQLRVTRSEGDPVMIRAGSASCVVRRWCFIAVCANHFQLHRLTRIVIDARSGSLDNVRELELATLHDDANLPGVVKREAKTLTLAFAPPCEVTGPLRHFRLAWREYREDASSPLLEIGSKQHPISLYGLPHRYNNTEEMERTSPLFRSAYATCRHQQAHCGMKELLSKHAELRSVLAPLDHTTSTLCTWQLVQPDLKGDCVSFCSSGCGSSLSPFGESSILEPQFTVFFPIIASLRTSSIPPREAKAGAESEAEAEAEEEFVCGTHDYILYTASSFHCEEVGRLPSLEDVCAGWFKPIKDGPALSSHLLLSCTLTVKA
ncbi:uncharacterized protein Tco025E_06122 [Trypanosoma conorhini]|uniref:Uncharacterized protein n=1 Tax=Trypanosoma conorhini TaxID=83891 RepID=A0A3R7KQW7_9TRYP|nr:uncharacterized protein Tco025E_06122 [Trypanosoma conorhini]RNF13571.1 hypothetical protein Tco025E_06122 [Trypanosoma conorhini]